MEEATVREVEKVDVKPTGKFQVVLEDGKYFVHGPDARRVSTEMDEARAHDLAQRFNRDARLA